jgi:hypothetical protein
MVLGAKTAIAAAVDAYFNLVTLLLPGDGTNGAQNNTFLDSSSNNFTITRNGNTTQGTFSPFSQTGWSNYFNGSTDYFNFAAQSGFSFGTGDWAIETFVYLTSTADQAIYDARPTSTNGLYPLVDIAGGKFRYYTNSASRIESDSTFSTNRWYHIVVSRVSGTTRMFIDGTVQSTTYTDSNNYIVGTNRPTIGVGGFNLTAHLSGYLSNMRVLKGSGYTSVTVPTAPLTAVTNTQLLTCQSNRFVDNSSNAFAITVNGTPSVQAFSPFAPTAAYSAATNGGSGYFDGTGDYLSAANNTALDLSTGDFTVECWFYANGVTAEQPLVIRNNGNIATGNDIQYNIVILSGSVRVRPYSGTTDYTINCGTVVPNSWNHVALVRTGSTFYGFLNGARSATTQTIAGSLNTGTWATYFGAALISGGGNLFFNGYLSSVRITKGGALYTGSTYTVPTAPLTTTVASGTANALLNFTNGGIIDATGKNVLETVGNAQISTTQSKFGGSSMYFDGTGDYLTAPASPNNNLNIGDFTLEFWVYRANLTGDVDPIGCGNVSTTGYQVRIKGTTGYVQFLVIGGATITTTTGIAATTWTHIAIVRSGTTVKIYINGTDGGGSGTVGNSGTVTTELLVVGANRYDYSNTLNGYMDDVRITKGYARYTASFTPPTAAFATQ